MVNSQNLTNKLLCAAGNGISLLFLINLDRSFLTQA